MKHHGRKARAGNTAYVMSRIGSGDRKGWWRLVITDPGFRAFETFRTKREAGYALNLERWLERRPDGTADQWPPVPILARRGSRPSVRRTRCRRLP